MIPNISRQETVIEARTGYKRSRKRQRILEILRGTGRHPTADWIYEKLKEEFPNLSMGTVYRNLHILIEQGLVSKIDFGSTFDRFDANVSQHYHFVCERCGSIIDLDLDIDDSLNDRVSRGTPFEVRRHRVEFYGLCGRCREERGEQNGRQKGKKGE